MFAVLKKSLPFPSTKSWLSGSHDAQLIRGHTQEPYNLLGYSMGGFIALATAAQLEKAGSAVGFVGIIDTAWPKELANYTIIDFVQEMSAFVGRSDRPVDHDEWSSLSMSSESLTLDQRATYALRWGQDQGLWTEDAIEIFRLAYDEMMHEESLLRAFQPIPVDAPIHVWWATKTLGPNRTAPVAWERFTTKGTIVEEIEGDHESIISSADLHRSVALALIGSSAQSSPVVTAELHNSRHET